MGNNLATHASFSFFIACTDVNAYLVMKYLLNTDETLCILGENWLCHWFKNTIWMRRHIVAQNITDREIYHSYWILMEGSDNLGASYNIYMLRFCSVILIWFISRLGLRLIYITSITISNYSDYNFLFLLFRNIFFSSSEVFQTFISLLWFIFSTS